jgi:hypothetical protein
VDGTTKEGDAQSGEDDDHLNEDKNEASTTEVNPGIDLKIPCFVTFAKIWSNYYSEANNIYYKLPEQLKGYFNIIEDRKRYEESVSLNRAVSRDVHQVAQSETRCVNSIPAIPQPLPPPPSQYPLQFHLIRPPPSSF